MAKTPGLGTLLTGIALGAAALFLSDEKNRAKVKTKLGKVSEDTKELTKEWQENPDKVIDQLKKKATSLSKDLEKSTMGVGKKLSDASKAKMLEALEETEKMLKQARVALKPEPKK